ncbi:MAG: hypothetical protein Q9219_007198 [cf. Caloplaca sp. 3 TL-2023]
MSPPPGPMVVPQVMEYNGTADGIVDHNHDDPGQEIVKPGMIPEAKNLYRGKLDYETGEKPWVDTYPDDLEEPPENDKTAQYALLIRNTKSHDGRRKLRIHSVIVQSPLLRHALGVVLRNYPGVTTTLDRLTFAPPFKPLVHRWANLLAAVRDETDPTTKSHLDLFHRIMQEELKDDLKARDDYILNNVITWDTCWMIFEPGTIVYFESGNGTGALRLQDSSYTSTSSGEVFYLTCDMVDWDGEKFGLAKRTIGIWPYEGTTAITDLDAFPLRYREKAAQIKQELIEKGRIFESLSGYHYKHYKGVAEGKGLWGKVKFNVCSSSSIPSTQVIQRAHAQQVDSRVIIDTYAWNRFNPNDEVSLRTLTDCRPSQPDQDDENDNQESNPDEDEADGEENLDEEEDVLTEDQLLLCNTKVKGYSLKNKKWMTFSVDSVSDVKWNNTAFERLVLPKDHKELILALIESQIANKETFDDVISGKGESSHSEDAINPESGLSSSEVETALSNVLEMCTKWNAVLLIDEADVFLEQRSAHDLERNKLVSIFLRILEYYEGILFLTTNRVENIDAAFQSRIHISMEYDALSPQSRHHIWSNFLFSLPAAAGAGKTNRTHGSFSDADLDRLARFPMNGREIKNVLKTAQLLAGKKGEVLGVEHVESVLAVEKRFGGGFVVGGEKGGMSEDVDVEGLEQAFNGFH